MLQYSLFTPGKIEGIDLALAQPGTPRVANKFVQGDPEGLGPGLGRLRFATFPRLSGRYTSYLLPKQHGGKPQINVTATQVSDHHGHPVKMVGYFEFATKKPVGRAACRWRRRRGGGPQSCLIRRGGRRRP